MLYQYWLLQAEPPLGLHNLYQVCFRVTSRSGAENMFHMQ